VTTRR